MFKILLSLLGKSNRSEKSVAGNLLWDIREAIKGKEVDPNELIKYQQQINEIQAHHRSVFVAGARPFILWVCGFALAWNFVLHPFINYFAVQMGYETVPPLLEIGELYPIIMALLGLGGMRSWEKSKNKTT